MKDSLRAAWSPSFDTISFFLSLEREIFVSSPFMKKTKQNKTKQNKKETKIPFYIFSSVHL